MMDVTSLLNSSSAALQRRDSIGSSTPSATGDTTATSTAVPTPSPEYSPSRRTGGAGSPNRNRTPWDAGGYSLPLTLDTSIPKFTSNIGRPAFYNSSYSPTGDDSRTNSTSPKSPAHKFSDSRSSLSSYTSSSTTSLSHSRISSLSTVSEHQPFASVFSDQLPLPPSTFPIFPTSTTNDQLITSVSDNLSPLSDGPSSSCCVERPTKTAMAPKLPPREPNQKQPKTVLLLSVPGTSRQAGRSPAGNNDMPTSCQVGSDGSNGDNFGPSMDLPAAFDPFRIADVADRHDTVGSPSDKVMIRRGPDGSLGFNDAPNSDDEDQFRRPAAPNAEPTRAHRRAVSAPDFSGAAASVPGDASHPNSFNQSVGTAAAVVTPAPPAASAVAPALPTGPTNLLAGYRGPNQEPHVSHTQVMARIAELELSRQEIERCIDNQERPCLYSDTPCNLPQVNVRKAISHIFGRNKGCTRRVPDPVWTHYCRKHYQRCRYRNGPEYACIQSRLIQQQLFRVQAWSDRNQIRGRPQDGILMDWALSVRKRENTRLAKKQGKARKDEELSDEKRPEDATAGPPPLSASLRRDDGESSSDDDEKPSAVNNWLLQKMRPGYSTHEMIKLAMQIQIEVECSHRQAIPDIEILPNILMDGQSGGSKGLKRKAGAHKRSQSMGTAASPPEPRFASRRVSQPNVRTDFGQAPPEKRPRLEDNRRRDAGRTERTVPRMTPIPERINRPDLTLPAPVHPSNGAMDYNHRRNHSAFATAPQNLWEIAPRYSQQQGGFPTAPAPAPAYYQGYNSDGPQGIDPAVRFGQYYNWKNYGRTDQGNEINQGSGQQLPSLPAFQPQFHPDFHMGGPGPRFGQAKHMRHNSSPAPTLGNFTPAHQRPVAHQEAQPRQNHPLSVGSSAGNNPAPQMFGGYLPPLQNGGDWQQQPNTATYQHPGVGYPAPHQQASYPLPPTHNTNGNMSRVGDNGGAHTQGGSAGENGENRNTYDQNQYAPHR